MRATTDQNHQDHDPTITPPTKACGPEGLGYTPSDTEDSFEEIER
jgi:hypothetical protein